MEGQRHQVPPGFCHVPQAGQPAVRRRAAAAAFRGIQFQEGSAPLTAVRDAGGAIGPCAGASCGQEQAGQGAPGRQGERHLAASAN